MMFIAPIEKWSLLMTIENDGGARPISFFPSSSATSIMSSSSLYMRSSGSGMSSMFLSSMFTLWTKPLKYFNFEVVGPTPCQVKCSRKRSERVILKKVFVNKQGGQSRIVQKNSLVGHLVSVRNHLRFFYRLV